MACPANGNIWWSVFYLVMLKMSEPFREIISTLSNTLLMTASRESSIGGRRAAAVARAVNEELGKEGSKQGQSVVVHAKRHKDCLDSDAAWREHWHEVVDVLQSDSASCVGSAVPSKALSTAFSAASRQLEATELCAAAVEHATALDSTDHGAAWQSCNQGG